METDKKNIKISIAIIVLSTLANILLFPSAFCLMGLFMKFMNEPNVSYTAIPSAVLIASLVLGWVYLNRPFRKSSLIVFTVSVIAFTIKLSMMSLGSILPMLYIGIEWIWLVSFIVAEALMIINVCKAKKQTAKDNNKTENQQ